MIEAREITRTFAGVPALSGVSFLVPGTGVVGFLGQNGAGKSTTLRILTTFLPPTSGEAIVAGFSVTKNPEEVRARLGSLPENPPLYPEMRVEDYLKFVATLRKLNSPRAAIEQVMQECGLESVSRKRCGALSKGFKQRVGIAQAIIHRPPVILLDEPTSGLDPVQIVEIRKLIKKLGESHTVLLSSHLLQEIVEISTRVVMLHRGRVVLDGETAELARSGSLEERFLSIARSDLPADLADSEGARR